MLGAAVALGGELAAARRAGHGSQQQVHVGLLTGLEHTELGVNRGQFGNQPVRVRCWPVLSDVPGGPAVASSRGIVGWSWLSRTSPDRAHVVDLVVEAVPVAAGGSVVKAAAPHGQPIVLRHGRISSGVAPPESAGSAAGRKGQNSLHITDSHVRPPPSLPRFHCVDSSGPTPQTARSTAAHRDQVQHVHYAMCRQPIFWLVGPGRWCHLVATQPWQ